MASVVLVDDMPDLIEGLCELLILDGHEVRMATSGAEAARLICEAPPDALLSDIEMPQMDGFALARWVRQEFASEVYLVAITGALDRLLEAREIFDYAMPKPVAYDELSQLLASADKR